MRAGALRTLALSRRPPTDIDGGDYGYMIHWCRTAGPGELPKFYAVSNGKTADEAIDRAIERYNRKHGVESSSVFPEPRVVELPVRGWVS